MPFCNLLKSTTALLTSAWLVAACGSGSGDGDGNSGGAGNAGTSSTAGSAGAGQAGAAQGGGGASSAGSGNSSGSGTTGGSAGSSAGSAAGGSGGSGAAPMCMGPKRDFTKSPHACTQNHDFPTFPWDYDLATPTVAGQPYAIEIDVVGSGSPTVVIWGGNAECPDQADPILMQMLPAGQHCLVLQPKAAYTHLVVAASGDTSNSTEQLRGVCGNGSCP